MNEDRILLYLLGIGNYEITNSQIEQLSSSDWDAIIQRAFTHKVAPLLYHRLQSISNLQTPANVMQILKETYIYYYVNNTKIYHELSNILTALKSEKIQTIVLKGAAFAELLYTDIALRPMNDIDLLIKVEDIIRVDNILSQLNWRGDSYELKFKIHPQWFPYVKYTKEKIVIDMKHRTNELPSFNLWTNARSVKIASIDTFSLGINDSIIYLCMHLYIHSKTGHSPMIWWYDIASFLRMYREEIDWNYIVSAAKKNRVEGIVYKILYMINKEFSEKIPLNTLNQLNGKKYDNSITINLQSCKKTITDFYSLISLISADNLSSNKNTTLAYLKLYFPSKEGMIYRYSPDHPKCFFFYYPIHIIITITKRLLFKFQKH